MVHPLLEVAKVTAPVPDPPALVSATDDPETTTRVVLDTVSVDCAAAQVRATAALVLGAKVVPSTVELALVAVTAQVPTVARLTLVPDREQPSLTVANVTPPDPDPPLLVSVTVVPVTTGSVEVDTVSASCAVANVKVTASLVAETKPEEKALVAVTAQVPTPVRVTTAPVMVHPLLDDANVTAPVPDPPALVSVTDVPDTTTRVVFDTVSVACAAAQVRVRVALVLGA